MVRYVAQGQSDRNGRNCCDHLCKQCNTVCSPQPPITIIFNHSTCKIYSPPPPNILSHSGFRHGVQDLIIWSNADMNEYGKTDILNNILQTKKLWDQEMKQVTPLSANMKFIVGIFHTGRIRRMMIQRHSWPSSTPPKRIQGNLKGSKPKIESDY